MTVLLLVLFLFNGAFSDPVPDGVSCRFKKQHLTLTYGMRQTKKTFRQRGGLNNAQLDTLSNRYDPARKYVEIIRQDAPLDPHYGIAIGFEFDAENAQFPYTPAFSKIQFKDFRWGGVEFGLKDTFNFTGVTNTVSDDLTITVEGFKNDTIFGRFSGLLLSGAGTMEPIDSGGFRVLVYRVR